MGFSSSDFLDDMDLAVWARLVGRFTAYRMSWHWNPVIFHLELRLRICQEPCLRYESGTLTHNGPKGQRWSWGRSVFTKVINTAWHPFKNVVIKLDVMCMTPLHKPANVVAGEIKRTKSNCESGTIHCTLRNIAWCAELMKRSSALDKGVMSLVQHWFVNPNDNINEIIDDLSRRCLRKENS